MEVQDTVNLLAITQSIDNDEYRLITNAILYSKIFFQLSQKTQVYSKNTAKQIKKNSFPHDRLLHTIEVQNIALQIASGLSNAIAVNIPLLKLMCLAHDIGHSPYGHEGEAALSKRLESISRAYNFKDTRGFSHNVNSGFIIKELSRNIDNKISPSLLATLIDGIIKHSKATTYEKKYKNSDPISLDKVKHVFFPDIFGINQLIKNTDLNDIENYRYYRYSLSIEGQILEVADDIASKISDIIDGEIMIGHDKIIKELRKTAKQIMKSKFKTIFCNITNVHGIDELRRQMFSTIPAFTADVIAASIKRLNHYKLNRSIENYRVVNYSRNFRKEIIDPLKKKIIEKVIQQDAEEDKDKGTEKMRWLFAFFCQFPSHFKKKHNPDFKDVFVNELDSYWPKNSKKAKGRTSFIKAVKYIGALEIEKRLPDGLKLIQTIREQINLFLNSKNKYTHFEYLIKLIELVRIKANDANEEIKSELLFIDFIYCKAIAYYLSSLGDDYIDWLYKKNRKRKDLKFDENSLYYK